MNGTQRIPRSRALLIAVDTYDDTAIPNLRTPRNDVAALAEVLRDPRIGGFDVTELINPGSTRLHRAVEEFFSRCEREDLMLLHFAGHGFLDSRNRLRFAAKDTEVEYVASTGLLSRSIVEIAENSRSRRIIFVIDCCYSGKFLDALIPRGDDSVHLAEQFPVQGKGTLVLAASGSLQYAFEDKQNSIFAKALVDGLRTGAADIDGDGWISVHDLYEYAYDRMRDIGVGQIPRLLGEYEGRLVLAKALRAAATGNYSDPVPPEPEPEPKPIMQTVNTPDPRHLAETQGRLYSGGRAEQSPPVVPPHRIGAASASVRSRQPQIGSSGAALQRPSTRAYAAGAVVWTLLIASAGGLVWLVFQVGVEVSAIISAIVIGVIIGTLGRLVIPGRQSFPIWLSVLVGVVAAILGSSLAHALGVADTRGPDWIEVLMQVVLAAIGVATVASIGGRRRL